MAHSGAQVVRALLIAAAMACAWPAGAAAPDAVDGLRIDDPDRDWFEALGAGASATGAAGPATLVEKAAAEYDALAPRQRLGVIAGLGVAFIVLIGAGLLMLERRAVGAGRARRRTARRDRPLGEVARPAREIIGDLGQAIRREAEAAAAPAEPKRASTDPDAPVGLDAYLDEIAVAAQARRARPGPSVEAACEDRGRIWVSPRVSDYPASRRRARYGKAAADKAEPTPRASPHLIMEDGGASSPGEADAAAVEHVIHRVRALGRLQTEARRRREEEAAARSGQGPRKPG